MGDGVPCYGALEIVGLLLLLLLLLFTKRLQNVKQGDSRLLFRVVHG